MRSRPIRGRTSPSIPPLVTPLSAQASGTATSFINKYGMTFTLDGGHAWPGGAALTEQRKGRAVLSATQQVWRFFAAR